MTGLYQQYAYRLKEIIRKNKNSDYEVTLASIASYAKLSYEWNQFYTDDYVEDVVKELSDLILPNHQEVKYNNNKVLFYDGFGLDNRGLAAIYARALINLGYEVIWVTTEKAKGNIPTIESYLTNGNSEIVFLNFKSSYVSQIELLDMQFKKYKPAKAFFYTEPEDVSAEIVFSHYEGVVKRFQINLTDEAFWLGINAFDYCIEFRDYGAGISRVYRNIPANKIVLLPYYPLINESLEFQGFPMDREDKKIIFSGGALFKTIGGDGKFYTIVDKVLRENLDTIFIYAGDGDDSELEKLSAQFQNRVFHIKERKDLFQLMEHIDVYLNTYPITGGLMMQYAAIAGKPPITLLGANREEGSGILLDQESAGIEFESVEAVVKEINRLLNDELYRRQKGEAIKNCVISPEKFANNLSNIMEGRAETRFADCPDTEKFRLEYVKRFSEKTVVDSIARLKNRSLIKYFPGLFITQIRNRLFR